MVLRAGAPRPVVETPREGKEHVRAYFSVSEAAALLGVSRVTVWRWISSGRLTASRFGHRTVRIQREDLHRFAKVPGRSQRQANQDCHAPVLAASPDWDDANEAGHLVHFYEDDSVLAYEVARFVGTALRGGDAGIVVATSPHRDAIAEHLRVEGLNVDLLQEEGRFISLDAAATLAALMQDGVPEPAKFATLIGSLVAEASAGDRQVHVFGEMVALLADEGNTAAAIRLESLWNDLQRFSPFTLLCAYPMQRLGGQSLATFTADVCREHSRVIPAESYSALTDVDDRERMVALLQQKAASLEAALAAERAARAQAEAALRARNAFVSVAAHELKTPLTGLMGQAQLGLRRLARGVPLDQENARQMFEKIRLQAQKLARLQSHLLDVSRLESGDLALDREPIDVAALLRQAVEATSNWSERHTITLTAPDVLVAEVDAMRVEQVLENVLDNAMKFSPDGGRIEVSLARSPGGMVEVAVRDHGLGIPRAQRADIFDCFYQAHGSAHRSGLGLGLYISRQIVEQHGGEMVAEFPSDGGVRMIVRLPCAAKTASPTV